MSCLSTVLKLQYKKLSSFLCISFKKNRSNFVFYYKENSVKNCFLLETYLEIHVFKKLKPVDIHLSQCYNEGNFGEGVFICYI